MKKYLLIASLIVVATSLFYTKVFIPKHTFQTQPVTRGDIEIKVSGIGNIGAKNIYKIGSVFGGKVMEFTLDEGDFIKKGATIAVIDSIDLKAKIAELDATIKKIQSDITSLTIDKKSADVYANYQKKIFTKNRNLYTKKALSELDLIKFQTNYETAKLKVQSLKSKIISLKALQEQVSRSKDGLKERLKRYTIVAPIDGYIVKKYITNFSIINQNQPLLEMVNTKDVWVEAHIDTRKSGAIKIGDSVSIKLRSSQKIYEGVVTMINPINNRVTNEREVDISFKKLPFPFYLEEQARVEIEVGKLTDVVKISSLALNHHNNQEGVWIVLSDNTLAFKPLKVLAKDGERVGVEGINRDAITVIADPKKKSFKEGMKIYHD